MRIKYKKVLLVLSLVIFALIILIVLYGYQSGSCKIIKKYKCSEEFCLYKEFNTILPTEVQSDVNKMIENKQIQKRVEIRMYPETLFKCAFPNKSGITIATHNINKYAPRVIDYYQNRLCDIMSDLLQLKLYPTDLQFPTSCVLLIYDKENDWINWHYDYNYYNGRFFTVLIPVTNNLTCTEFQMKDDNGIVKSINLSNGNSICFEGNYLFHRASKLCKGEKRVILSCQYVTDNSMSYINNLRIKLKDYAYIGKLL